MDKNWEKVMLEVFFNYNVIYDEYISEGQIVNKEQILKILEWLWNAIRWKWLEKWAMISFFYTTMFNHITLIVKKYFAKHNVTTLEHPLYSPERVLADFYLFLQLKMKLKEYCFADSDKVNGKCNEAAENPHKKWIEEVFWTVVQVMKEVCRRKVIWRPLK